MKAEKYLMPEVDLKAAEVLSLVKRGSKYEMGPLHWVQHILP